MQLGTIPRVLALTNGEGNRADAICWAWVEEDGRVLENGKFQDLRFDEEAKRAFVELVQRRKPDVIGVAGFSVQTRSLLLDVEKILEDEDLRGADFEDPDTGEEKSERLEVVMVNDEVAKLYSTGARGALEHPTLPTMTRYCVALAKYLQNPMKEYAALGKDIISVSFHPSQNLVAKDKVAKQLETALVDMVNLCGVDINEAVSDSYTANLLPYVCGLGPRKATSVLKAINANVSRVNRMTNSGGNTNKRVRAVWSRLGRNWRETQRKARSPRWDRECGTTVPVSCSSNTTAPSKTPTTLTTRECIPRITISAGRWLPMRWNWMRKMSRRRWTKRVWARWSRSSSRMKRRTR
jgi:hypothetical protein